MLSEALPIYSGGLGNVAGDQLKATSDLGVPVVGVGLLYQQGYFRQVIDKDGAQQALFPYNDPGQLPITPVRQANGEWLRLEIALPGYSVWLRAWQVQVGRVKLYLLDSNDPANIPAHRAITSELYGGGPELRLKQELLLGIGGWRLLRALGIRPEVCHLNEGHAAFAVLERARSFMQEAGQPFEVALAATRAGNLFTTHTAVAAGFDRFAPALIEQYLGGYAAAEARHDAPRSARPRPPEPRRLVGGRSTWPTWPSAAAARSTASAACTAQVSRKLFEPLFPRWPEDEVPVGHVTNGVHMPTWDSAAADDLWTEACGQDRWLGTATTLEQDIRRVPDAKLWQFRQPRARRSSTTPATACPRSWPPPAPRRRQVEGAKHVFDPKALTLGFARRFATYKRPNLLLHDPARLLRLLSNPERPVQLVIAGKAHPEDRAGQALIREWIHFIRRPEVQPHAVFLSDYDMLLTEHLVQGVDVWINTPRRPWEACGTSGMKVLVNGGLNLSELDGWWAEAYTPEVGWALGDGREHGDDPAWDAAEADALYDLLEREVIPEFYARDGSGISTAWVKRMRESMAQLTPRFSTNRSVREYTEQHYLPAAAAYRQRAADNGAVGKEHRRLAAGSPREVGGVALRRGEGRSERRAARVRGGARARRPRSRTRCASSSTPMARRAQRPCGKRWSALRRPAGASGRYVYSAAVSAARPPSDYTARVIPHREGVAVPLEVDPILWQR